MITALSQVRPRRYRELSAGALYSRVDVDLSKLSRTDHTTYCPYKGDCSYYSLPDGGERAANAVWTYETPFDAVASIKDYLAFYSDHVKITEVSD